MNNSTLAIIVYLLGLVFGALILDLWSAETRPKALIGIIWTSILLITLFYIEKNHQK